MEPPAFKPRIEQIATLLVCCAVFLIIPLKVASYGNLPPDDALRHAAFAVDHRPWSEVLLLNPQIDPQMDSHPGWHAILRWLHGHLGFSTGDLVCFSFTATFVLFAACGLVFSGSPVAWLLACVFTMLVDYGLFARLLLGRPFAISVAAFVALLFVWTRDKPLRVWSETVLTMVSLTLVIWIHPSVWYLWILPCGVLAVCRHFRSALILGLSLPVSMLLAVAAAGSWYNVVTYPLIHLWHALGDDPLLGINLVGEFQPSGGPVLPLIAIAGVLAVKHFKGHSLREELKSVDFCLVVLMWALGLKVVRFWIDWGAPAFTVWSCRQLILLGFDRLPRPREALAVTTGAAAIFYLAVTADVGGRYTQNLKNPVLTHPVAEFRSLLPDAGGTLYCTFMHLFYQLYYRLPDARFRFSTGFEPGMMPPEDLKVLRAIQFNDGSIKAYEPWLNKMTPRDRVVLFSPGKPEWPGIEFSPFYTLWIGKKVPPKGEASVKPAAAEGPDRATR
jgi:hypothetical protein